MNAKQIFKFLCEKIETESKKGTLLICVKQQERKGKNKFKIYPGYKNFKLSHINVEKNTLPGDTIIPIRAFLIVIEALFKAPDKTLKRGNAQQRNTRIGGKGLEETTLEAIVAINAFGGKRGSTI